MAMVLPLTAHASSTRKVGTPQASAAGSLARMARKLRPIQDVSIQRAVTIAMSARTSMTQNTNCVWPLNQAGGGGAKVERPAAPPRYSVLWTSVSRTTTSARVAIENRRPGCEASGIR